MYQKKPGLGQTPNLLIQCWCMEEVGFKCCQDFKTNSRLTSKNPKVQLKNQAKKIQKFQVMLHNQYSCTAFEQFNRNHCSNLILSKMSTNLVVWVWLFKIFLDLAENLIEPQEQEEIVGQFKDHHARLYRKRGIKHPSVSKFFGHRQICYIWYSVKYQVCFNYKTIFRHI